MLLRKTLPAFLLISNILIYIEKRHTKNEVRHTAIPQMEEYRNECPECGGELYKPKEDHVVRFSGGVHHFECRPCDHCQRWPKKRRSLRYFMDPEITGSSPVPWDCPCIGDVSTGTKEHMVMKLLEQEIISALHPEVLELAEKMAEYIIADIVLEMLIDNSERLIERSPGLFHKLVEIILSIPSSEFIKGAD